MATFATQTITMNGFTIIDDEETLPLQAEQRRFSIITPNGNRHDVLIEIDIEVLDFVERITARRLLPESSFWTEEARRLISDFLWNEGRVPPTRRLILKDLEPDRLVVAARWNSSNIR